MKKDNRKIFTLGRSICLAFAALLIISGFLTWGSTKLASVIGYEGDGTITIGIGVLAIIMLFIKRIPVWMVHILAVIGLAIGIIDFAQMSKTVAKISGHVGIGLYLLIIACVGIIVGAIIEMIQEKRSNKNLFYLDENK